MTSCLHLTAAVRGCLSSVNETNVEDDWIRMGDKKGLSDRNKQGLSQRGKQNLKETLLVKTEHKRDINEWGI